MSSKNQAKIYLWNANGIKSKIDEVVEFLYNYSPEILCINETKLNQDEELIFLKTNYNFLCKSRNSKGGGVAILVRKDIKYEETKQLDKFESEHLCIKTNYKNQDLYVITYYNPPSKIIEKNMLEEIEKNFQNYIICGDLNSRSKSFGCNGENQNGSILNEFIQNSNVILANNQDITYFRPHSDYKEILDIILVSKNFHRYCLDFEVKYECSLESDHYPVELKIQPFYKTTVADVTNTLSKPEEKKEAILNYSKANLDKFRSKLDEINIDHIMTSLNVDEINNFIIQNIITAANETIPFMKSKNTNPQLLTRLPKYLINMIKRRRYIKKKLIKDGNNINLKKEFYILSKNI
jgi:exonuclease III